MTTYTSMVSIICRYGEAGLKNGMGGMGGADMGGFNNPFDLFEQVALLSTRPSQSGRLSLLPCISELILDRNVT